MSKGILEVFATRYRKFQRVRAAGAGVAISASALLVLALLPVGAASAARPTLPVSKGAPVITGAAVVGSTLTASTGTWSNSPTDYTYQWLRCNDLGASCTPISGATANSYTVSADDAADASDAGRTLVVAVRATNTSGSATANSAPSDSVIGQQAFVKAGNAGNSDEFGDGVAISGDTMVVGAPYEDSSTGGVNTTPDEAAANSGAAYVFVRSATGAWTQQAYLKASNPGAGDLFGYSVAISGDTIVVGAFNEDSDTTEVDSVPNDSASNSGAAYVFTRSGSTWTQAAYLKAENAEADDLFGLYVAVDGSTVAVGAPYEDSNTTGINTTPNNLASNSGAVYVFSNPGGGWAQDAYIKASNTGASDYFGQPVSLSGDTLAVGADGEDSGTTGVNSTPNEATSYSGAAYVFTRTSGTWSQQAYLKASNPGADDYFGHAVAVSGDMLVVGASNEDSGTTGVNSTPDEAAPDSGAAYVFIRTGSVWQQEAYLKASNPDTSDRFARTIAFDGNTIVMGAYGEDSSTSGVNSTANNDALNSGAAYVFQKVNAMWAQTAYLKAGNPDIEDGFGFPVAVSGKTVVTGSSGEDSAITGINGTPDNAGTDTGAAYVYSVRIDPKNVSLPTISGPASPVVGNVFTASLGTWSYGPLSYAYQWRRCDAFGATCSNIVGATAATYAATVGDIGSTLVVRVTATNSVSSTSATSAASEEIGGSATAPTNTSLPLINDSTPVVRQKLTATTGDWVGAATFTYQWQRCQGADQCFDISRATKNVYTVTSADLGAALKVKVTASNSVGSLTVDSELTGAVAAK